MCDTIALVILSLIRLAIFFFGNTTNLIKRNKLIKKLKNNTIAIQEHRSFSNKKHNYYN